MGFNGGDVVLCLVAMATLVYPADAYGAETRIHPLNQMHINLMKSYLDPDSIMLLTSKRKFVVGTNSAVDLIVKGTDLMEALGVSAPSQVKLHDALDNLNAVAESFAQSLSTGTGSERFFTSAKDYQHIVDVAMQLKDKQLFTGGNAALIGQHIMETAMNKPREVILVSAVGPTLQSLLHPDIIVPQSSSVDVDEVHLILEFPLNEKWGSFTSPRANRFIFSHDRTNAEMRPLSGFAEAIENNIPDIAVFSGVHAMELEPIEFRTARVQATAEIFKSVNKNVATHLELASLGDGVFVNQIAETLIPSFNSLGLNEQELKLFAIHAGGPHLELLKGSFETPDIAIVSDMIHWLFTKYGTNNGKGGRLSRIHFHTLAFHIVANRKDYWSDAGASAAFGALACSERACKLSSTFDRDVSLEGKVKHKMSSTFSRHVASDGDDDGDAELTSLQRFDGNVAKWTRADHQYALAPVLVCTPPEKTVGLGDSISAAGLEMHKFLKTSHTEL